MLRYNPMGPRQTDRNGIAITTNNDPSFLGGFNNASTATNQLMNDTTWI